MPFHTKVCSHREQLFGEISRTQYDYRAKGQNQSLASQENLNVSELNVPINTPRSSASPICSMNNGRETTIGVSTKSVAVPYEGARFISDRQVVSAPNIEETRSLSRRRFVKSVKRRWRDRQIGSAARSSQRFEYRLAMGTRIGRRRKRTAVALGVSALGLSGASQLALSAYPIAAASFMDNFSKANGAELTDLNKRVNAANLNVSEHMLEAMVEEEGVRYDVYRDVAGYPTVGVGHRVLPEDNLRVGDMISHRDAMSFLEQDISKAEEAVRNLVGDLAVSQNEFDALVDLVFNVGEGTVSERESPRLNEAIEAGDHEAIAQELEYTSAKNKVATGLVHRSERRTQIFMNADYSDPREETSPIRQS
jgi:GH24 family phage-related lysozyme (muramidase)